MKPYKPVTPNAPGGFGVLADYYQGAIMKNDTPSTKVYVYNRSTPGTHLYKEEGETRDQSGNIYVVKEVFDGKPPNRIKVTIEAA